MNCVHKCVIANIIEISQLKEIKTSELQKLYTTDTLRKSKDKKMSQERCQYKPYYRKYKQNEDRIIIQKKTFMGEANIRIGVGRNNDPEYFPNLFFRLETHLYIVCLVRALTWSTLTSVPNMCNFQGQVKKKNQSLVNNSNLNQFQPLKILSGPQSASFVRHIIYFYP